MTDSLGNLEINKRIAEFMGWSDLEWRAGWYGNQPNGQWGYLTADYAHSMDDLIPVIEKLRANDKYINVSIIGRESYAADLYDKRNGWIAKAMAETMAMAACLAIIDYLEGKEI